MRVRLLVSMAGPGGSWQPNHLFSCSEAEGNRLVAARFAEYVSDAEAKASADAESRAAAAVAKAKKAAIEAATVEAPERAVSRKKVAKRKPKAKSKS